jgi:hypothetical protein
MILLQMWDEHGSMLVDRNRSNHLLLGVNPIWILVNHMGGTGRVDILG